jgi:hypothetical protein
MSPDNLLPSTSGYDLQYSPHSPLMSPTPSSPYDNEQMSLQEAIEDPHIWQHSRQGAHEEMEDRIENLRLRTNRRNRGSWVHPGLDDGRGQQQSSHHNDDTYGENCDHTADESYTSLRRVSAPTPPPFTVTAASEEEESSSNEEAPSAAVLADLLRRESRWRAETDDDDDDEIVPRFGGIRGATALDYRTYSQWRERHAEPIRATRRGTPSRIQTSEPPSDANNLIAPHARFFIAKDKSKITIKFHPAM